MSKGKVIGIVASAIGLGVTAGAGITRLIKRHQTKKLVAHSEDHLANSIKNKEELKVRIEENQKEIEKWRLEIDRAFSEKKTELNAIMEQCNKLKTELEGVNPMDIDTTIDED